MARHRTQGRVRRQIQDLFIGNAGGVVSLLGAEQVERAVREQGVQFRDCPFTPLVTLWTFLAQVLSPDGSCRQAVAKLLAFLAVSDGDGQDVQPDTGPYCKPVSVCPRRWWRNWPGNRADNCIAATPLENSPLENFWAGGR